MKHIILLLHVFVFTKAEFDWRNVIEQHLTVDVELFSVMVSKKMDKYDNRIVGGEEAEPHQFPYQAGLLLTLEDGRRGFCGGSLISQNFVLTAAHCVDGMRNIEVILGAHKIQEFEDSQVRMNSSEFIVHENWDPVRVRNDIALVKLPEMVQLNENIKTINLPAHDDNSKDFHGYFATVSGWGRFSDRVSEGSKVLRYVNSTILENYKCFFSYPFAINNSHICLKGTDGKSSCNGDSGGPLIITTDEKPIIIGIVSFGRTAGCEKGYPGVYTRVTSFLEWIQNNADL